MGSVVLDMLYDMGVCSTRHKFMFMVSVMALWLHVNDVCVCQLVMFYVS